VEVAYALVQAPKLRQIRRIRTLVQAVAALAPDGSAQMVELLRRARIRHRAERGVVLEGEAHLARAHPQVRLIEPARVALRIHPVMHVLRVDEPGRWRCRCGEAPRL